MKKQTQGLDVLPDYGSEMRALEELTVLTLGYSKVWEARWRREDVAGLYADVRDRMGLPVAVLDVRPWSEEEEPAIALDKMRHCWYG